MLLTIRIGNVTSEMSTNDMSTHWRDFTGIGARALTPCQPANFRIGLNLTCPLIEPDAVVERITVKAIMLPGEVPRKHRLAAAIRALDHQFAGQSIIDLRQQLPLLVAQFDAPGGVKLPQQRFGKLEHRSTLCHAPGMVVQPVHEGQMFGPALPAGSAILQVIAGGLRLRQTGAVPHRYLPGVRMAAQHLGDIGVGAEAAAQSGRRRDPLA